MLKSQVEQKLRVEVRCRAAEARADKLTEGLTDILQILRQSTPRFEAEAIHLDEPISEQSVESGDLVAQIIDKAFALIRAFDSNRLDLQHQLDKARLSLDDTENIRFDLEIANDEKMILESELD